MPRLLRPSWREIINAPRSSRMRLFLSDFNQTWTLAELSKMPNIKFYKHPSGGGRVVRAVS